MSEVCHDVCIEPPLQPLSGEHLSYATTNREDSVRLDIKACGFWGLWQQCAFFDVRVFNPTVPSCRGLQMAACYRRHEGKKCRTYEQRIREVEHGSLPHLYSVPQEGWGELPLWPSYSHCSQA